MIPARWMTRTTLPKNPNGKIDRPKLKELFLQTENCGHSQNDPMHIQKN
jgi:acyl-coenzyme A synthetase/AMP-(fatty) acid ligase